MAASTLFKRDDSVLLFNPRDHVGGAPYAQRRYLLWPVWVYRVVAPTDENRRLNVLQKAVLGLCNAGIFEARRVAESLDIHLNLAKEIILELQQDELVDSRGLPTAEGLATLQDETIKGSDAVTVGYVFQDPFSGELWPRFVQEPRYAELRYEDEHPRLVLGKTGKPFYQWAYQYMPHGISAPSSQPAPKHIIDAVRQHKRAKRYGVEWMSAEDEYESYADKELQGRLERVSLVDTSPQPMFLATYLYLDKADVDWYVCDPFGFGPSFFLRRNVDGRIKGQAAQGLREQLQSLLKKGLDSSLEDIDQWHKLLTQQAELYVDENAPYARNSNAYQALLAMETAYHEAKSHQRNCPTTKLEMVLGGMRKTLEALFAELLKKYPSSQPDQVWKQIPKKQPEDTYNAIASQLGFNTPIPKNLGSVQQNKLKSVIEYSNTWNLRPLIAGCLLIAHELPTHPLRRMASRQPDLLDILEKLIDAGGQASHHGEDKLSWSLSEIAVLHKSLYSVVNLFASQNNE